MSDTFAARNVADCLEVGVFDPQEVAKFVRKQALRIVELEAQLAAGLQREATDYNEAVDEITRLADRRPVERKALAESIAELDQLANSDEGDLWPSQAESILLVLHELSRLQAAQPETWKVLPSRALSDAQPLEAFNRGECVIDGLHAVAALIGGSKPTGEQSQVDESAKTHGKSPDEIENLHKQPVLPPLDDNMREILGRPNFMCITLAKQLRLRGHTIASRSEDEQAAVIYFLLSLYLEHGEAWLDKGNEYFNRPLPAATTGEPLQEAKE